MKQKGFTLIELLVTVAIIGLLATLTVASYRYARNYSRIKKSEHDIAEIYKAIQILVNDTEEWPGHQIIETVCTDLPGGCPGNNELCGIDANNNSCPDSLSDGTAGLTKNDGVNPYPKWSGPYMKKIPLDPWGYKYFFDTDYQVTTDDEPCNGAGGCVYVVVVGSYGPDGMGNNQYNEDDIIKIITK